jgi:translation initiation factor IF-2
LSKLRVVDMAGEFEINVDEVIAMLRSMDVPVLSPQSGLSDDQVSRIRARWEREKRARLAKAAAPAPTAARRRKGAAGAEPAAPAPAAAPATPTVSAESEPNAAAGGSPVVRRRKAADVAAQQAMHDAEVAAVEAQAAAAAEAAAARAAADALARAALEAAPSPIAEPPSAGPESVEPPPAAATVAPTEPVAPARPTPPTVSPTPATLPTPYASASPTSGGNSGQGPTTSRPPLRPASAGLPDRPRAAGVGMPPRQRPGQGGGSFGGPRPVASATPSFGGPAVRTPGGGPGAGGQRPGGGAPGAGGGQRSGGDPRRGGGKKGKRGSVDQAAVDANISKTMSALRGPARRGRRFDDTSTREELEAFRAAAAERERTTVRVNEFITVSELAQILKVAATEIVGFAFKHLGLMVTINQRLDFDQIELIAGEFGFQAVKEEEYAVEEEADKIVDAAEDLVPRPPVVTIMGHVDHGKTSLLDYIRKANVVAGEAGGITQHIGAYHVTVGGNKMITFLDTPGHEAFTAMRARGAQVTDIVVLVVAADDKVMPQTIEAISHAKNAGVPLVVAINKIDSPGADPLRVRQDLLQQNVVLEDFGGTVLASDISAKKGTNIDQLLDQILLQAEILDLKANPARRAQGAVVEAQLDPGKGPVATVLVQNGTLRVGDDFICGVFSGRVRALIDERGRAVKSAGPAIPVQVLGMTGVPMAGDQFVVVEDAAEAREIAQRRERLEREARSRRTTKSSVSLADFMAAASSGEKRTLKMLIKADQGGPAEALADALQQLSNAEVQVEVIQRGVGAISESDILLAKAAGAIIVGFHVRPDNKARSAAEREGVDIKLYRIIYEAVADVKSALEGMLRPEQREVIYGEAEVREVFRVPKLGAIAGCIVRSGMMNRQGKMRVIRDGVEVYEGSIASLRRFKDDVKEVKEGYECGIAIENFNDIKVGDVLECFRTEEIARTL